MLKALEKHYRLALEDVNLSIRILQADEQTQSKIHRIRYQETLKKQLEGILEKLHTDTYRSIQHYLNDSYTDAFVGVMYDLHGQDVPVIAPIDQNAAIKAIQLDTKLSERKIHPNANGEHVTLYESLGVDVDKLKKTIRSEITRGISTGMKYEDIARNVSMVAKAPLSRAKTIVRTEGHRIQQASQEDARQAAKARGADVVKQWDSTLDGETRSTHRYLDGQIREVNKPFTSGTKKAMFPGDFGDPAEDCNCRCTALTRARKALDEEELAILKERAEFFGLSKKKTQAFSAYKRKYLKAAKNPAAVTPKKPAAKAPEVLKKQGKTGIIKMKNSDLPNGLPMRGEPDSTVDKTDENGKTLQRRVYDSQGMAQVDYDTSDHNRPDIHPTGAHKHVYDHSGKKPKRSEPKKLTEEELEQNSDIIKRGDNYHDED